jgi:transposase
VRQIGVKEQASYKCRREYNQVRFFQFPRLSSAGAGRAPALYARMSRAHALQEGFRDLFAMRPKEAGLNLKQWLRWASHSRLGPMVKLARTFREQKSAILGWFPTQLSNNLLEGLNSLSQATRAKARGYISLKYGILGFYHVGSRFEFQLPRSYAVTHTK